MMESVTFLQGDCREMLATLPAESVHCCVTSPPYFQLRDYGCAGQIGLEETPEEYLRVLVEVFREVRRVLRSDGTCWINMGDSHASKWPCNRRNVIGAGSLENGKREARPERIGWNLKDKDLMLMPHRLAIALQDDGWWVRSDCVWSKPNPMPESVTDRPTRAHEYVFLLAKSATYYYDADAIRERSSETSHGGRGPNCGDKQRELGQNLNGSLGVCTSGRNKRSVWEIATQPTPEAHFATFPEALVTPCILAGTSEWGCCGTCGAPWVRMTTEDGAYQATYAPGRQQKQAALDPGRVTSGGVMETGMVKIRRTTGWEPSCKCGTTEGQPCTVLDCFAGSGTVMKVATKLGRRSIGIDLNGEYLDIARERNAQQGLML